MFGQCQDPAQAWVVCAATSFIQFFGMGFAYAAGVYFVVFLEVFGKDSSETALVTSLNYGFLCFVGPLASVLLQYLGFRCTMLMGGVLSSAGLLISAFATKLWILVLGFGVFTGVGYGLTFTTGVVAVGLHFTYYRSLAIALSLSGSGIGAILHPLLSEILIEYYGWRGALLLMSGITLNICVCAMFMLPVGDTTKKSLAKVSHKQHNTDKRKRFSLGLHLFKRIGFLLTSIIALLCCFGMNVIYTHISAYGLYMGLSKWHSASLISALGFSALVGRMLFGILGQILHSVHPALILGAAYILGGISIACVGAFNSFINIISATCVAGLCLGAYASTLTDTVMYVSGRRYFHIGYGWNGVSQGIGSMLGGPAAGLVFDLSGYYQGSFFLGGLAMFLGGVLVLGVRWTRSGDSLEQEELPSISIKDEDEC